MAALNRWTAQKRDIEMQKNLGALAGLGIHCSAVLLCQQKLLYGGLLGRALNAAQHIVFLSLHASLALGCSRILGSPRCQNISAQGKATYMGGALPDTAAYGPYKQNKRPKIASEASGIPMMQCNERCGRLSRFLFHVCPNALEGEDRQGVRALAAGHSSRRGASQLHRALGSRKTSSGCRQDVQNCFQRSYRVYTQRVEGG